MRFIFALIAMMSLLGCDHDGQQTEPIQKAGAQGGTPAIVNVSLFNSSSNALDWVKLKWDGPDISGGIIPAGISKTDMSVKWPYVENATITFVDDKTRARFNIEVSLLEANQKIRLGGVREVTFRILAYDKATVLCE